VPVEGVGTLLAHGVDERIKGVDPPVRHAEFWTQQKTFASCNQSIRLGQWSGFNPGNMCTLTM
jgi:hypothetical protein